MNDDKKTYWVFTRAANNFEEFSTADKVWVADGLTWDEARDMCQEFNNNRSQAQVSIGLKAEFEAE